jgi:hypothetical protein
MVLAGGTNAAQDPAASRCLALLNHGQHSSPTVRFEQRAPGAMRTMLTRMPEDASP